MLSDPELERVIEDQLSDDEKVVWSGQPAPSRFARAMFPMFLFGLLCGGFAIFWEASAILATSQAAGTPGWQRFFFPLFGLPFVAIGFAMFTSPLWGIRKARRTIYVVTNQRAMIITVGRQRTLRQYALRELARIDRIEQADGSGDLIFDHATGAQQPYTWHKFYLGGGFLGVANVREVERHLKADVAH